MMNRTILASLLLTSVTSAVGISACVDTIDEDCYGKGNCNTLGDVLGGAAGAAGDTGTGGSASSGTGGITTDACNNSCADPAPLCKKATATCVECLGSDDCDGDESLCDTDAGKCVACLEDTDCDDPGTPVCDGGECKGCVNDDQCLRFGDTPACKADTGACVQCTGTNYSACETDGEGKQYVCDSLQNTCSTQTEASQGLCQECVSDAACGDGQLCVKELFQDSDVGLSYRCQQVKSGFCERPYMGTRDDAVSIDGSTSNLCVLVVSTCKAHEDFRDVNCETTDPDVVHDNLCGEPELADAACRKLDDDGMGDNRYRCTARCLGDDDCRTGSTCDDSVNPPECTLN